MPGKPGTKKWVEKYGESLVCVRYKYDKECKRKVKTVEITVEESTWEADKKRIPKNKIFHLRIVYEEINLRKLVRAAGGRWNKKKQVWELPYKDVVELGLEKRIVQDML